MHAGFLIHAEAKEEVTLDNTVVM